MTCKGCGSYRQSVFNGEIAIHFRGLEGLNKSSVFVFPRLAVCLHCGFAEFTVPERELQVLEEGCPVDGAVVLQEKSSQPSKKVRTTSVSAGIND